MKHFEIEKKVVEVLLQIETRRYRRVPFKYQARPDIVIVPAVNVPMAYCDRSNSKR